jgi:hypothetical protein
MPAFALAGTLYQAMELLPFMSVTFDPVGNDAEKLAYSPIWPDSDRACTFDVNVPPFARVGLYTKTAEDPSHTPSEMFFVGSQCDFASEPAQL